MYTFDFEKHGDSCLPFFGYAVEATKFEKFGSAPSGFNEVKGAATDEGNLVWYLIFDLEKHGDSHLPFLDGTSKMTNFPKFAWARVFVKMKFGSWDFTEITFKWTSFKEKYVRPKRIQQFCKRVVKSSLFSVCVRELVFGQLASGRRRITL